MITQKELILNNEMNFKMYACTQTDTYKNLPGHIEMPQVLILEVN